MLAGLRSARCLARLVLVWFACAIGVAVASPLVAPKAMELVCSSAGAVKLIVKTADGSVSESPSHTLDCPLCLTTGCPPEQGWDRLPVPLPLGHVLQSIPAAQLASLVGAPLPPRGPPPV